MSGEVADRIDKAIAIFAYIGEVGGVPVAVAQIGQQPEIIFSLCFRHIAGHREELLHELHHFPIGQFDPGEGVNAPAQLPHIRLRQHQGLFGLVDTAHHVFGMLCRPDALCSSQGQIQGVLADDPDWGHGDFDTGTAVMGVHDHQVGSYLIPGDDITLGNFSQHPNLTASLQRSCRLIGHARAQEIIGKAECVPILYDLIPVRYDAEGGIICASDVGLIAGDTKALVRIDVSLENLPIQASVNEGVRRSRSLLHFHTQAVPGFIADIEHGFYICGHRASPPLMRFAAAPHACGGRPLSCGTC